ncbi:hypothetical protein [Flectobacillus sp. BAB-3569]|nr:hypothetical protein [Flectobacillus sp. BAB-3569]
MKKAACGIAGDNSNNGGEPKKTVSSTKKTVRHPKLTSNNIL